MHYLDDNRITRFFSTLVHGAPVVEQHSPVEVFDRAVAIAGEHDSSPVLSSMATGSRIREAAAGPVAGRDPSRWPDSLLELFLAYLALADLAQARLVCRQWHSAASDRHLQGVSLLRAYPRPHRQQLQRAVHARARHSLTPYTRPAQPPGPGQREYPAGAQWGTPAHFACRMQQLLGTDRFSTDSSPISCPVGLFIERLICSPDGQWLAAQGWMSDKKPWQTSLDLWHAEDQGWRTVFSDQYACQFDGLMFSADSRRLHALDDTARLLSWQLNVSIGSWQFIAPQPQNHQSVYVVKNSHDGQYMAALCEGQVQVFTTAQSAHWQRQWVWRIRHQWHPAHLNSRTQRQANLPQLTLSQTGQHLVLLAAGELFVAHRTRADWHPTSLPATRVLNRPYHTDVTISADESLLALATRPEGPLNTVMPYVERDSCWITLYRGGASGDWEPVTDALCDSYAMGWQKLPMAFNPGGHELIFPCRQDNGSADLRVLSTIGPPVCVELKCTERTQDPPGRFGQLSAFHFSLADSHLAAVDQVGVHIWRRDRVAGWTLVAQIQSLDINLIMAVDFTFCPDGYHCAIARGIRGEVSIWGPANKGRAYTSKMCRNQENIVSQLLFTSDASQLVMKGSRLEALALMPETRASDAGD
ncbi:MAG: F-box-like domain-containing protein [Kistimonas sp.]|nr:F-box-like domain-containing protein [Kistimonas sp.]